jgi:hypothetical protein
VRIVEVGEDKPLFTCQDRDLEGQPDWIFDRPEPCLFHISDIPSFEANLEPKPFVLGFCTGAIDMTPHPYGDNGERTAHMPTCPGTPMIAFMDYYRSASPKRTNPPTLLSSPETDTRRLTDWQVAMLTPTLVKYHYHKVLILAAGGPSTWQYARSFGQLFRSKRWDVKGPIKAPPTRNNTIAIDVQMSVSRDEYGKTNPLTSDLRNALINAQVKGGDRVLTDPNVPVQVVVLWVGVKSPDSVNPDNYPGVTSPALRQVVHDAWPHAAWIF